MPALEEAIDIRLLAEAFEETRLAEAGVTWEAFLETPEAHLAAHGQDDALTILLEGYYPLMPEQARVRQRLEAGDA
mgnify:CR=1 FL=1